MTGYQGLYRRAFEILGRPLKPNDGVSEQELREAEQRLGLRLPDSLADFYRCAGKATDYTSVFNRLLPLSGLALEEGKLTFYHENQSVVVWGTNAEAESLDDPPVYETADRQSPLTWEMVNEQCSVFLLVTLHWEAAFGGAMIHVSTAVVDPQLVERLDRDWSFVGEVREMKAYNRPGFAICILKWDDNWRIFAGSSTEAGIIALASELGVTWEAAG
jgi:hypothetical protein